MNSLGEWTRLELAADGSPHLIWSRFIIANNSQLSEVRYGRWTGASWIRENIDDNLLTESRPDIAQRVDGRLVVAYTRDPGGPAEDQQIEGITYRHQDVGQPWSVRELVAAVPPAANAIPAPVAISVGGDGLPRIAYWSGADSRVHVRRRDVANVWTELTTWNNNPGVPCAGAWPDMALDP